jgi:FemAB-related protein (PEP-CTERM system-associated)
MRCLKCDGQDSRWDDFVQRDSQGTFFHLLKWRDLISRNFGYEPYYLYVEDQGQIRAILPLFLVKSLLFGKRLVSLPVVVYGGLVSSNYEASLLLLAQAEELARRHQVARLEIRGNPYAADMASAINNSSYRRNDHHVTFLREIGATEETNLASIPRKQRRMIRQAQKHGLRSTMSDERLKDCFRVYAESLRNLGTPIYAYSYFHDLKKTFGDQCQVLVVELQNKVIAGVLTFLFKDQVLPYYAGSLPDFRHVAPNDFMYWELMCYGGATGYRVFDFGRSKRDTGSFAFKRHWGFEPTPLPCFSYQVGKKDVGDVASLNANYEWAIKLWRRLPLRLTIALGPRIAPHLPW